MSQEDISKLVNDVLKEYMTKTVNLGSATILIYDHIVTLPEEVCLLWPSSWTIGKFVFFATRYLIYADVAFNLASHFASQGITSSLCLALFKTAVGLNAFGIFVAELILVYRTWIIWDRSRSIGMMLVAGLIILGTPCGIFVYLGLRLVRFKDKNTPFSQMPGCWQQEISKAEHMLFVSYILLCLMESLIIGLTLFKGFQHFKFSKSKLSVTLYRDGMIYYIYALGISVYNIFTMVFAPTMTLLLMQRVLHAIFTSRILLNLRQAGLEDRNRWAPSESSLGSRPDEPNLDRVLMLPV